MNIHPSHIPGVLILVGEALRLQPDDAAKVARRLYNDESTYDELHAADVADASRAVDKALGAEHAVLEPRVKELVAAFALVTPAARACDRCHRLDLRRRPPWERDTRAACPCGGAWASVAFAAPVVAWTDGRTYPAGTEADDEGVPITDAALTAYIEARGEGIHRGLARDLAAAGLSLTTWARWLLHASRSFDARAPSAVGGVLRSLVDPSALALDAAALTRLVARAARAARETTGTAQATDERGATVTAAPAGRLSASGRYEIDTRPVPQPLRTEISKTLAGLYGHARDARRIVGDAGLDEVRFEFSGASSTMWFFIVDEAAKHCAIGALLRAAQREYPRNPDLLPLLGRVQM